MQKNIAQKAKKMKSGAAKDKRIFSLIRYSPCYSYSHHHTQTNTTNKNKKWALLHPTGVKTNRT